MFAMADCCLDMTRATGASSLAKKGMSMVAGHASCSDLSAVALIPHEGLWKCVRIVRERPDILCISGLSQSQSLHKPLHQTCGDMENLSLKNTYSDALKTEFGCQRQEKLKGFWCGSRGRTHASQHKLQSGRTAFCRPCPTI